MTTVRNTKIPRVHKHTLIEMNMAVFMARRDAAFSRVVEILRGEVLPAAKPRRRDLYGECHYLLQEAIATTQRSQAQQETPIVRYLQLLRDTVGGCLAIVQHEVNLGREAAEISRLVGTDLKEQFAKADNTLSFSETTIQACIDDLLKFGITLMDKDSRERMSMFSENDLRRYNHAREEYDEHYRRPVRTST